MSSCRQVHLFISGDEFITRSLLVSFYVFRSQISVAKAIDKQYNLRIEKGSSDGINTLTRSLCYALLSWSIDSL